MPASANDAEILELQTADPVRSVLRQYWGYDQLRPLQGNAISAALAFRDSLVVMPTGGGKSLCYQIPPLVSQTVDVVVSPLISLMKDQVDGLVESGYPAAAMHSGMTASERRIAQMELLAGKLRLLFVAPERLLSGDFLDLLKIAGVRRFSIDEAHCISQWGHDFRKEYRMLAMVREKFPDASMHAFTATATPRVQRDIVEQLQLRNPAEFIGCFDRPNLVYRILPKMDVYTQTLEAVKRHADEAAIVYCISRRDTETMANFLKSHDIKAAAYHAGLTQDERKRTQEEFANERLDVVAATVAFGMGIDRSNVRCVIHASMPKSLEHYQQETGRAGRDGLEAECVLFYSGGDSLTWERILKSGAAEAHQPAEQFAAQVQLLQRMRNICTGSICRHRAISEYFGQKYDKENCTACDICLSEVEFVPDSTVVAQKILSCVYRVEQKFGVSHVVDVLLGADTEAIRKFGHEKVSTYGILQEFSKKELQALVHQLIDAGHLARSEGDYPTLHLNSESWPILKGQKQARLIRPLKKVASRTAKGTADRTGVDEGLFEHLRKWRKELAAQRGVPPYIIFADTVLLALAKQRPTTLGQLRGTPGIGEKRAEEFGSEIVAEIAEYCRINRITINVPNLPATSSSTRNSVESKEVAFDLFSRGLSIEEVATTIGRARSTTTEYLALYLMQTPEASIDAYVDVELQKQIREAAERLGCPPMKGVFDDLAGAATYDDIRIFLALMHARGEDFGRTPHAPP